MKSFIAFLKKEMIENVRNERFLFVAVIFVAMGIMNPALAKLTPLLMELLSEELAETGMTLTKIEVDAMTSWGQFYKNIPMALIAFVLLFGNTLTKEYESGNLILIITKGVSRYKILVVKSAIMLLSWTVGYWISYAITYVCNAYFWDNGIASNLLLSAGNWWLFGIFVISLTVLFSVINKNYVFVLLETGGVVVFFYLVSLIPKCARFLPTALMNPSQLLVGAQGLEYALPSIIIVSAVSIAMLIASIPIFNKKSF